jgi:hypothetical protein
VPIEAMPTGKITPQEKKRLSLLKDRRNCFGENDKSSRRAIRSRKRWVNRSLRRSEHQALVVPDVDAIESSLGKLRKNEWKKVPDTPLGEKLLREKNWDLEYRLHVAVAEGADTMDRLRDFLRSSGVCGARLAVLIRRVNGIALDRNSTSLRFDGDTLDLLRRFLARKKSGQRGRSMRPLPETGDRDLCNLSKLPSES